MDRGHELLNRTSQGFIYGRNPLAYDDDVIGCNSFGADDITVSCISEGGQSDASHRLYRELDPFTKQPPEDSFYDDDDLMQSSATECIPGSWVAVASSKGQKTNTSAVFLPQHVLSRHQIRSSIGDHLHSHNLSSQPVEFEDVDNLELARTTRRRTGGKRLKSESTRRPRSLVGPPPTSITGIKHWQRFDLPSSNQIASGLIDCSASPEAPFDLDWDHEPGLSYDAYPRKFSNTAPKSSNPLTQSTPAGRLRESSQQKQPETRQDLRTAAILESKLDVAPVPTVIQSQLSPNFSSNRGVKPKSELVDSGFMGGFTDSVLHGVDDLTWEGDNMIVPN